MITRVRLEADDEDLAGGLETVEVRHADVEQHDVGMQPSSLLDRPKAIFDRGHQLEVVVGVEDRAQSGARDALVPQSVIEDLELDGGFGPPEDHMSRRTASVLEHVCERLLDDPVRGDPNTAGNDARLALDTELHQLASLGDLVNQRRNFGLR